MTAITYNIFLMDADHPYSYLRLLHYFNEDIQVPKSSQAPSPHQHGFKVPIIGFSATFSRADQHSLLSAFEEIVFHRDMKDMLSEKHLTQAKLTIVKADLELDEVETSSGDFKNATLARKVNTPEINELIVRTYLHRACKSYPRSLSYDLSIQSVLTTLLSYHDL